MGDAGADVVGWFPLGDRNRSAMLFLAQATCLADWRDHQHHASAETWRQLISFKAAPANVLVIPQCFRRADGGWAFSQQIANSVLIDRVRLVFLLDGSPPALGQKARETLNAALAYREDTV
jgi:hypothetical protein